MTASQLATDLAQALQRFQGNPRPYHERILAQNGGKWFDWETYVRSCYEAVLQPGSIAVDCGANHGGHTIHMARAVASRGEVLSIEPLPHLHEKIRTIAKSYDVPDRLITSLQCAVSEQPGEAEFFQVLDETFDGLSGLRKRCCLDGQRISSLMVEVKTLDQICAHLPRLDFIKMDIEGAELDALRGARKTLSRFRPVITVEQSEINHLYFGYDSTDLLSFMHDAGYTLFDLFGFAYSEPSFLDGCLVWDFVAFPNERSPDLVIWKIRQAMRNSGLVL